MSQVYLLEFFVDYLDLDHQILRDSGETKFVIRINIIDFQTLEITRQNLSSAKIQPIKNCCHQDFRTGQAFHFTIPPLKLAQKILKHPLSIKIFREGDSFPVCLARLPLSGCLCDQAKDFVHDLKPPKPYVFGGRIELNDIGGNPSGSVGVTLRITCYGKCIFTSYVLGNGCFLFKNDSEGAEYRVEKISEEVETEDDFKNVLPWIKIGEKSESEIEKFAKSLPWENLMRDVAGISLGAGRLSLGKPPPKPRQILEIPTYVAPVENAGIKKGKKKDKKKKKKK